MEERRGPGVAELLGEADGDGEVDGEGLPDEEGVGDWLALGATPEPWPLFKPPAPATPKDPGLVYPWTARTAATTAAIDIAAAPLRPTDSPAIRILDLPNTLPAPTW